MNTISNQRSIGNSTADQQRQQAIQTWYEPALTLLTEMLNQRKATLRKRGSDEANAAVHKDEFRHEMHRRHKITLGYAYEIERSLFRAGRISYLGQNFLLRIGDDI